MCDFYFRVSVYMFYIVSCNLRVVLGNVNFTDTPFVSVWNSPSEICDKSGIPLNLSYFDIVANSNDTFEGNEIVIFYENRLGLYPKIDAEGRYIHGGLPQLADINKHLVYVTLDVAKYIPDKNFSGLAVIDWESWRPIYDRNGYNKEMKIYIQSSESLVRKMHPDWPERMIVNEARKEFETSARKFMQTTLDACRTLRPRGQWGFYGFPNCYNYDNRKYCSNNTMELNDRLSWLFQSSSSLFPSIYLEDKGTHTDRHDRVYGQLKEAERVKQAYGRQYLPIFAYTRYKYAETGCFYDEMDLNNTIRQVADAGLNGVALWDSSASFRNATDCKRLKDYTDSTLGPFVRNITVSAQNCSRDSCNSHGRCVNTNWKSVTQTRLDLGNFLTGPIQRLFEKFVVTLYSFYEAYLETRKTDRTVPIQSGNSVKRCVCFKGWTGKFCDRQSYSVEFS